MSAKNSDLKFPRRSFLKALGGLALFGFCGRDLVSSRRAAAQAGMPGFPLPDEAVEVTLKRLFGGRKIASADDKVKLELPVIAEDGGNVTITVDTVLPVRGAAHVSAIYIIADKNRRPMLAKFSFAPGAGQAFVSSSIRLATTTDVRAVVEMNDGTLYGAKRHVRVTISGCDLPPQR